MKLNHQYNTGLLLIIIIVISTAFTERIQVRQERQNSSSTSESMFSELLGPS